MSTTTDPIATYAQYVTACQQVDELNAKRKHLYDPSTGTMLDLEGFDRNTEAVRLLDRRMHEGPDGELLRICWLVDRWDTSTVPPELGEDGEPVLGGTQWNEQRDDVVTHAEDVRWLVEALVAEVRRLRPELDA